MTSFTTPFALFMRRELPSRQTIVLTLVCLFPSVIYLILRAFSQGSTFFENEGALLFFQAAIPLVPIFYSVAAFHEDFEQRTIVYLLTRPPSRASYVIAKFLTAWSCSVISIGTGLLTLAVLSSWSRPDFASYYFGVFFMLLTSAVLGTAVYTGVFLIFGLIFKYPVILGLLFTAGWEYLVGLIPGKLQYYTISLYVKSLFIVWADAEPTQFFPEGLKVEVPGGNAAQAVYRMFLSANEELPIPGMTQSIATLSILAAVLFGIAVLVFREREDA